MSFAPLDYQPSNRQSPFSINLADHQGDTLMPDFTAIHHKHQFWNCGQMGQQLAYIRQVKSFVLNSFILHPKSIPLDLAVRNGLPWCFAGDSRQLTTPGLDNPCNQSCQRIQHSRKISFRFAWKQWFHRPFDGTIYAAIVTHGFSCSFLVEKTSVP